MDSAVLFCPPVKRTPRRRAKRDSGGEFQSICVTT